MSNKTPANTRSLIFGLYGIALVLIFLGGVLIGQGKSFVALPIFLISIGSAVAGIFIGAQSKDSSPND